MKLAPPFTFPFSIFFSPCVQMFALPLRTVLSYQGPSIVPVPCLMGLVSDGLVIDGDWWGN